MRHRIELTLIAAIDHSLQSLSLLIGAALVVAGIVLVFRHHRHWESVRYESSDRDEIRFEQRKYRRRAAVACLLSVGGFAMAGLYWTFEPRVFSILILILVAVLLAVLVLASLDMLSVGIRQFAKDSASQKLQEARQDLVDEYLRLREKIGQEEDASGEEPD